MVACHPATYPPCRPLPPSPALPADKDVIGLAQTGSGKTGAFALPILQHLLDNPHALCALVLSPTRELAIQISEQFEALGAGIGVKCAVLVGGIDMMAQAIALAKRPHVVVGTPGRVVDHLSNTKGFSLKALKHLVLDEADRLLNMDFEQEIDQILKVIPKVGGAEPGLGECGRVSNIVCGLQAIVVWRVRCAHCFEKGWC